MLHIRDWSNDVLASAEVGIIQIFLLAAKLSSTEMSSFEDLASLFYVNLRIKLAVSRSYFIFRIWILTDIELNIFLVSARIGECWARSAGTLR